MKNVNQCKSVNIFFFIGVFFVFLTSCDNDDSFEQQTMIIEKKVQDSDKNTINGFLSRSFVMKYIDEAEKVQLNGKLPPPFDSISFNKVIAYDYNGESDRVESVYDDVLGFAKSITKQQVLDEKQTRNLIGLITKKETYGSSTAACFNPNWSVVFFENNKVALVVDFCLDCNYLISSVPIPTQQSFENIVQDGNFIHSYGFSKKGRKEIKQLAKELDMKYGNFELDGIFD